VRVSVFRPDGRDVVSVLVAVRPPVDRAGVPQALKSVDDVAI
jgi:hypothetical protein